MEYWGNRGLKLFIQKESTFGGAFFYLLTYIALASKIKSDFRFIGGNKWHILKGILRKKL